MIFWVFLELDFLQA